MDDFLTARGLREGSEIALVMPLPVPIPPSPDASKVILEAFADRGIEWHPSHLVRGLEPSSQVARFEDDTEMPFDLFLGVPQDRVPAVVAESGMVRRRLDLGRPGHPGHPLARRQAAVGDVTSVGTPKAGVFAEGQASVVAGEILAMVRGGSPGGYAGRGPGHLELEAGTLPPSTSRAPGKQPFGFLDGNPAPAQRGEVGVRQQRPGSPGGSGRTGDDGRRVGVRPSAAGDAELVAIGIRERDPVEVTSTALSEACGARIGPASNLRVEIIVGADVEVDLVLARRRILDFLKSEWVGRLPPATIRKKPSMSATIYASNRSAHHRASGSGSAQSKVTEAMLTTSPQNATSGDTAWTSVRRRAPLPTCRGQSPPRTRGSDRPRNRVGRATRRLRREPRPAPGGRAGSRRCR